MSNGLGGLKDRIDAAMRSHHERVEKAILMAILNGHSTKTMRVTEIKRIGASVLDTVLLDKNGREFDRITTELPFEWR